MDNRKVKCISYLDYFKFYISYKDYEVVFRIDKYLTNEVLDPNRIDFIAKKDKEVLDEITVGSWYRSRSGRYIFPDNGFTVEVYHNPTEASRFTVQIFVKGLRHSWIEYFLENGEEHFLSHSMLNTDHEFIIGDSPISYEKDPRKRGDPMFEWNLGYINISIGEQLKIKESLVDPKLLDVGLADYLLTLHGYENNRFIGLWPKNHKECYISKFMLENGYPARDGLMFSVIDYSTRKLHTVRIIGDKICMDGISEYHL